MDATQIILIVFIVILVICYPILISVRNKKENQRMHEQTNSLKRGDKVLTTSGLYGTIVDLHLEGDKKVVTIETGTDKKKGYFSIDAYAIYTVFKDDSQELKEVESLGEKKEEPVVENSEPIKEEEKVNSAEENETNSEQTEENLSENIQSKPVKEKKKRKKD